MATYNELITMVRDWANRDSTVLPDSVIQAGLRYAADQAYRSLEIPPLEYSRYYITRGTTPLKYCRKVSDGIYTETTSNNVKDSVLDENLSNPNVTNAFLPVPADTISFIYLRTAGTINRPEIGSTVDLTLITEDNQNSYGIVTDYDLPSLSAHAYSVDTVFDERVGARSFYDYNDNSALQNYFTRKGANLILSGDVAEGYVFELFYYRRLPALDGRYSLPVGLTLAQAQAEPLVYEVISLETYSGLSSILQATYTEIEGSYVRSAVEVPNWLKDHNERVLLFGALHRAFDYLQEDAQSEKYKARFVESIQELNAEETKRKLSAGISYMRYSAGGLI